MKWHIKVRLKGFLGEVSPKPLGINLLADAEWREALNGGRAVRLQRLEIGRSTAEEEDAVNRQDAIKGDYGFVRPLSLTGKRIFTDYEGLNLPSSWVEKVSPEELSLREETRQFYKASIEQELSEKIEDRPVAQSTAEELITMSGRWNRLVRLVAATGGSTATQPPTYGKMSEDEVKAILDQLEWMDALGRQSNENLLAPAQYGGAYNSEAMGAFGDEVPAFYHSLSAPNISYHYTSTWKLRAAQPLVFDLYRFRPSEGQDGEAEQVISWGRYELAFKDAKTCEISVYKHLYYDESKKRHVPMTEALREKLKAEIETLKDQGRPSPRQRERLVEIDREVAGRKRDYKLGKLDGVTDDDGLERNLQPLMRERKQIERSYEDGLSSAVEDRIAELEKKIYAERTGVELRETTPTLYNRPIKLTITPSASGFISIALEGVSKPFIFEDKEMTVYEDSRRPKALQNAWNASRVTIRGKGGAFAIRFGRMQYAPNGRYLLGPFYDSSEDEGARLQGYDMAGTPANWRELVTVTLRSETHSLSHAGKEVKSRIESSWVRSSVRQGSAQIPVWWLEIKLHSNARVEGNEPAQLPSGFITNRREKPDTIPAGLYSPLLWWAQVRLPGGADNPERELVAWDSENYASDGVPPIADVAPAFNEKTGEVSCNLSLTNPFGSLGLPSILKKRLIDVSIVGYNDEEGQDWTTPATPEYSIVKNGVIESVTLHGVLGQNHEEVAFPPVVGLLFPERAESTSVEWGEHGEVALKIRGLEMIAEERAVEAAIIGDGSLIPTTTWSILQDGGLVFSDETFEEFDQSVVNRPLPQAALGKAPGLWPEADAKIEDFLRRITGDWGGPNSLSRNGNGWRYGPQMNPEEAVIRFSTAHADLPFNPDDPHLYSRRFVLDEHELPEDDQDFFNAWKAIGGLHPVTKKRLVLPWENPRSWEDDGAPDFIGYRKEDASIESDVTDLDELYWLLFWRVKKTNQPGKYVQIKTVYQPDLRPGMMVLYNEVEHVVWRLGETSAAEDSMNVILRRHFTNLL